MCLEDIRERVMSTPFFRPAHKNLDQFFKIITVFGRRELWYYNTPFVLEDESGCHIYELPSPICPSFDRPQSQMIKVYNYCRSMCQHQEPISAEI